MTFFMAYIENLFPPSPSDVFIVFIGTLVGIGVIGFIPSLTAAALGSLLGFVTAYWIGRRYGRTLIQKGWLPFITDVLLMKVDIWFAKYHDWIIVGNRFLAGTRAVIAFAAGITHMPFRRTALLSLLSALAWNAVLLFAGAFMGERWQTIEKLLSTYGWVVTLLLLVSIAGYLLFRRTRTNEPPTDP